METHKTVLKWTTMKNLNLDRPQANQSTQTRNKIHRTITIEYPIKLNLKLPGSPTSPVPLKTPASSTPWGDVGEAIWEGTMSTGEDLRGVEKTSWSILGTCFTIWMHRCVCGNREIWDLSGRLGNRPVYRLPIHCVDWGVSLWQYTPVWSHYEVKRF